MNQPNIDAVAVSLSALSQKLADHWSDCLWLDASEMMAVGNAIELLTDRAATVAKEGGEVGIVGTMPGTASFTMACFKADEVPVGTKLYATPKPKASAATQQAGDEYTFEEMRQNYLDLLSDVLEAKEVMVKAGIEHASFPEMFAKFAAPISEDTGKPAARKAGGLSLERMAAIYELRREDAAVHAFLTLMYRDNLEWDDVLSQMVLHLAGEKATLTARLIEVASTQASVDEDAAVDADFPVQNSPHGSVVTRNQEERAAFRKGFQAAVNIRASQIETAPRNEGVECANGEVEVGKLFFAADGSRIPAMTWPRAQLPQGEYAMYVRAPASPDTRDVALPEITEAQILEDSTLRYHFGLNGGSGPVSPKGWSIVRAILAILAKSKGNPT